MWAKNKFFRSLIAAAGAGLVGLLVLAGTGPGAPVAAQGVTRFAIIGDYGVDTPDEAAVAALVKSWSPDFIVTTGDNNYYTGSASTIDQNIGQYYHEYIFPYLGSYGPGAATNRFFPVLGNHDWETPGAQPYLDYFTLPGNERYYDFAWGPVHFFMLDSDPNEPDGTSSTSAQATWFQGRLAASTAPWKLVIMHHPPYSSGWHGNTDWMQWPYQAWGATAVVTGHDHDYERILINGFPYFINGAGGDTLRSFETPVPGSTVRYNTAHGAMLVEASPTQITFYFYSVANGGTLIDTYTIRRDAPPPTDTPPSETPGAPATPRTPSAPAEGAGVPAPLAAPLCADLSGTTNPIIRADVPTGTVTDGSVFCRVIAENGTFVRDAAEIGHMDVLNQGVIQAVDVFGMTFGGASVTQFNSSVKVCLAGSGRIMYLDAATQPRALSTLPVSSEGGYTCALIYHAGTVALVR